LVPRASGGGTGRGRARAPQDASEHVLRDALGLLAHPPRPAHVVIVGGATSGCVWATALDAFSHGFQVVVAEDGCFDRVVAAHDFAIDDIDLKYGRAVGSAEVIERMP